VKPEPISKKPIRTGDPETDKEIRQAQRRSHLSLTEKLLKGNFYPVCYLVATSCVGLREL
jgi:E3 ubiquitin-protein ligase UHRF1